jgi:hypothetical protein
MISEEDIKTRAMELCEAKHGAMSSYKVVSFEPLDALTFPEVDRRRINPNSELVMTDGLPEWGERWMLFRRDAQEELAIELDRELAALERTG